MMEIMKLKIISLLATIVLITVSCTDALQLPTSSSQQQQSISSRRQFMNHVLPSTFVAAAAVTILAPSSYAASDASATTAATTTAVGQKAPTFTLPNSRGEGATSLDQLVESKKWTVLYFYPGAFTQGKWSFKYINRWIILYKFENTILT